MKFQKLRLSKKHVDNGVDTFVVQTTHKPGPHETYSDSFEIHIIMYVLYSVQVVYVDISV